ncbi:MAG: TSUP family transporter [Weeksellaceae bacterium]|nr:TSUP family transporter [Weeksellaceae bacterium]
MEFDLILLLCSVAFFAGFVDSIVGGGGLIQTPLSLALLPHYPVATIIGSLKIPAFTGTAIATSQYLKKIKIQWKLFAIMAIVAFVAAFLGSRLLLLVDNDFMKPLLFVVLIALFIYTIFKKDFGQAKAGKIEKKESIIKGILIAFVIGMYDGFIGPATGTFFIVAFVTLIRMDFLQASATAKLVNLATNFGSICLFLISGKIIWAIAIPMAISNGIGGFLGAKLAIAKGNTFIRYIFIFVILLSICRFGYEIFSSKI